MLNALENEKIICMSLEKNSLPYHATEKFTFSYMSSLEIFFPLYATLNLFLIL